MFINPGNSSKLAKSVQRDYLASAEAHRQAQLGQDSSQTWATVVRVGVALAGLVTLFIAASQTMS